MGNYAGIIVEQRVRKLTKTQAFKDALENFTAQRNQPGTGSPAGQTPEPLDPQEDEDAEETEDLALEDDTDASRAADLYNRIFFSSNRDTVNFGRAPKQAVDKFAWFVDHFDSLAMAVNRIVLMEPERSYEKFFRSSKYEFLSRDVTCEMLAKASPTENAEAVRASIRKLCELTVRRRRREVVDVIEEVVMECDYVAEQGHTKRQVMERRMKRYEKGVCGLEDMEDMDGMGCTSFMNCVLQCLFKTVELADYFITNKYKENIDDHTFTNDEFAQRFANLLDRFWSGRESCIKPVRLHELIARKKLGFVNGMDQDCQMFCKYVLKTLHSDFIDTFNNEGPSEIENIFKLVYQLKISCSCRDRKGTERSYFIRLLPTSPSKVDGELVYSLKSMLADKFKMPKRVKPKKSKCKHKCFAWKKIKRIPPVLVIFIPQTDAKHKFEYPINGLNMNEYLSADAQAVEEYDLYAVCKRMGPKFSRSFVAKCKNLTRRNDEDVWHAINNEECREDVAPDYREEGEVCVLFYTRTERDGKRAESILKERERRNVLNVF